MSLVRDAYGIALWLDCRVVVEDLEYIGLWIVVDLADDGTVTLERGDVRLERRGEQLTAFG